MKEIVNNSGLPADSADLEQIANQMMLLAFDENVRKAYSESGFKRAIELSWEKTALETLKLYEKLMSVG